MLDYLLAFIALCIFIYACFFTELPEKNHIGTTPYDYSPAGDHMSSGYHEHADGTIHRDCCSVQGTQTQLCGKRI